MTDLTKEIAGVKAIVGWDRDYNDGELSESELIFLAQDKQGNVWHLGEYVEHYSENGHFEGGRLWLVGYLEGVKAGIHMTASPKLGDAPYSQGFAPHPWDWDDNAQVYQAGQKTCVRTGCYSDVLVIREYEPTIPGISQLKYYAKGVGSVRIGWLGEEDEERETMELTGSPSSRRRSSPRPEPPCSSMRAAPIHIRTHPAGGADRSRHMIERASAKK